jgi:RNA polymerase sigma-70 factor (ECF subfamily)
MLSDRFDEVLARAVAGEPDAFAEIWVDTQPVLLRYLRVHAGDNAEDVASETWLKVVGALDGFRGDEQGFRAWVVTIARNVHRDQVRRAGRRREHAYQPQDLAEQADRGSTAPDAADLTLERLGTDDALDLVRRLPGEQAEMVLLRVVVGLDVAEVARITGRTPGAVRVAVHRALRRLGELVADRAPATAAGARNDSADDDVSGMT